jgi:type IV pilus assembly protein PilV
MNINCNKITKKMTKGATEEGITLLEVIIAIAILTFGLLSVGVMQASSIKGNSFARGTTEGTTWAGDAVERLMMLSYDHDDLDQAQNPHQAVEGRYTITWNITDDTPIANTKTLDITVTWNDRGVQKTLSLQQIIPKVS